MKKMIFAMLMMAAMTACETKTQEPVSTEIDPATEQTTAGDTTTTETTTGDTTAVDTTVEE